MKIIGINASPREGSNVKIALETALEAAESKGAQVKLFNINDMNIKACQADNYCKAHDGKCAVDDDMQEIYKEIQEADGVILAFPVYFFDINAQAKTFIDRLYAFYQFPFAETYGTKKFAIITSQGMPDESAFKTALNTQLEAMGLLGFEKESLTILTGNNIPGEIKDKQDQLDKASKVGESMVE